MYCLNLPPIISLKKSSNIWRHMHHYSARHMTYKTSLNTRAPLPPHSSFANFLFQSFKERLLISPHCYFQSIRPPLPPPMPYLTVRFPQKAHCTTIAPPGLPHPLSFYRPIHPPPLPILETYSNLFHISKSHPPPGIPNRFRHKPFPS